MVPVPAGRLLLYPSQGDPGWLPQDGARLLVSVGLHHISLERKTLASCFKGRWSPDSCSFQISKNLKGKDFSAGKARETTYKVHLPGVPAAALMVPGKVGWGVPGQALLWVMCRQQSPGQASGDLCPSLFPLDPPSSDSPWGPGDSCAQRSLWDARNHPLSGSRRCPVPWEWAWVLSWAQGVQLNLNL